jgi:hypothetical protein
MRMGRHPRRLFNKIIARYRIYHFSPSAKPSEIKARPAHRFFIIITPLLSASQTTPSAEPH